MSDSNTLCSDRQIWLQPTRIQPDDIVDRIKLIVQDEQVSLLYSTQQVAGIDYALVVHRTALEAPEPKVVLRAERWLPVRPRWGARIGDGKPHFVYERAGGAINAIMLQVDDCVDRLSSADAFESFSAPHFVHSNPETIAEFGPPLVAAVANCSKVVLFDPANSEQAYKPLPVSGPEAIVGGSPIRPWVLTKSIEDGHTLFDSLPGRLALHNFDAELHEQSVIQYKSIIGYDFDAAAMSGRSGEVIAFVTGEPAWLLLGSRPEPQARILAGDNDKQLLLSAPSIALSGDFIHLAALAHPPEGPPIIVYARQPLGSLL